MGKTSVWTTTRVRSFAGWFRHMTLVLLVLAMLTVVCAREQLSCVARESNQTPPFPIALTVPEVRRLLGRLLFPLSRSVRDVLAWSWWRRCQQAKPASGASNVGSTPASCSLRPFF
jgi:hypothetical protein